MHLVVGLAIAVVCALVPWAAAKVALRSIVVGMVLSFAIVVTGAVFGIGIYPFSSVVVGAFGLLAGVALGRGVPPRFRPFVILLVILSVLDVAQNIAFAGPSVNSTAAASAPDPHLIWLNVRFPLPEGHFNIGFADVILIAATSENLRRRGAPLALALSPGVIAIALGEGLVATLPANPATVVTGIANSLVLFLTAGYLVSELAVRQRLTNTAESRDDY